MRNTCIHLVRGAVQCGSATLSGVPYCEKHDRRCGYMTATGRPCRTYRMMGEPTCARHRH